MNDEELYDELDQKMYWDEKIQEAIWQAESLEEFVAECASEWADDFGVATDEAEALLEAQAFVNKALDKLTDVKLITKGWLE